MLPLQIFDATTNTWRVIDEKTSTDVLERIIQGPQRTKDIYVQNITDIDKYKSVKDSTETNIDISNRTDITDVTKRTIDELDINKLGITENLQRSKDTVKKTSILDDVTDNRIIREEIDIERKTINDTITDHTSRDSVRH